MDTWKPEEVRERTRELETAIVERLARRGVELRLSEDPFDFIDGRTLKGGNLSAFVEIKTRTEPLDRLIEWGTLLFDAAKLENLRRTADRFRCDAVILVTTADGCLLWHRLTARHIIERRDCRRNHHSSEYVRKDVELVPLHLFAFFDSGGVRRTDWTWEEIGEGSDPAEFTTEVAERAAVMHFDGGVDARLAERIAEVEVKERWRNRDRKTGTNSGRRI